MRPFWGNLGAKLKFWTLVENLQLSIEKLQIPSLFTFLIHYVTVSD